MDCWKKHRGAIFFGIVALLLVLIIVVQSTVLQKQVEDIAQLQKNYDELNNAYNEIDIDLLVEQERQKIRDFIQIADEAYYYKSTYHISLYDQGAFPGLDSLMGSLGNAILIDYDSLTIGFCYYNGAWRLRTFPIVPGELPKEYDDSQTWRLALFDGTMTFHYDYLDGDPDNELTPTRIILTSDVGSVYIADLIDPETGLAYDIGEGAGSKYFRHIKDFQEKKQENATDPTESP